MLKEMKSYVRLFEKHRFDNIVLSAKSADTVRTIEINRAISKNFDYPIHHGLTHAGLPADAMVPSSGRQMYSAYAPILKSVAAKT